MPLCLCKIIKDKILQWSRLNESHFRETYFTIVGEIVHRREMESKLNVFVVREEIVLSFRNILYS